MRDASDEVGFLVDIMRDKHEEETIMRDKHEERQS